MMNRQLLFLCAALLLLITACAQLSTYLGASSLEERGVTVEPVATFVITNRTDDGTLTFLVERVGELETDPGEPSRRLVLSIVVANQGDSAVSIMAESFRVRDAAYNHYPALVPETVGLPYLIGVDVPPASSLVGLIQVEVPVNEALADLTLVWCLDSACQSPLEAPLTLAGDG